MRELEVALHKPGEHRLRAFWRHGGGTGYGYHTLTEKGQFIAVGVPPIVLNIAREVPPLRFELVVYGVVRREIIMPARQSDFPPVVGSLSVDGVPAAKQTHESREEQCTLI